VTLIDLDASRDLRQFDPRVLAQAASEADMPLTFGGGISTLNDISAALDHGADKVVIGAWGRREPHMIAESASRFGSQCIVSAIDVTADMSLHGDRSTGLADLAVQSALAAERNGAGELMVTFVDGDGTGQGLDLRVLSRLRNAVRLPIVAGGGCGKARHVVDALLGAGMDGVSVSILLARQDQSLMQIRAHAIAAGLSLRSIR
jgi:cyclase